MCPVRKSVPRQTGAAERVTYAAWEPGADDWDRVLASGSELIRPVDPGDPETASGPA